jgi:hypothetical protein
MGQWRLWISAAVSGGVEIRVYRAGVRGAAAVVIRACRRRHGTRAGKRLASGRQLALVHLKFIRILDKYSRVFPSIRNRNILPAMHGAGWGIYCLSVILAGGLYHYSPLGIRRQPCCR